MVIKYYYINEVVIKSFMIGIKNKFQDWLAIRLDPPLGQALRYTTVFTTISCTFLTKCKQFSEHCVHLTAAVILYG